MFCPRAGKKITRPQKGRVSSWCHPHLPGTPGLGPAVRPAQWVTGLRFPSASNLRLAAHEARECLRVTCAVRAFHRSAHSLDSDSRALLVSVNADKWAVLEAAYRAALQEHTPGLVQTFFLHSSAKAACWQIATVWKDRAALNAMRHSGETPQGVLIFLAAGAEPTLTIFDVPAYLPPTNFA